MIWGYIYIALILGTTLFVLKIGDNDTRLSIATLTVASALTVAAVYASGAYFASATALIIALDTLVLGIFVAHALYSDRHWPMLIASLQLITCGTHFAKLGAPDIVADVYAAGQGHWAYLQMIIIVLAAFDARAVRNEMKSNVRTKPKA